MFDAVRRIRKQRQHSLPQRCRGFTFDPWVFAAPGKRDRVPAPACGEERRVEHGLDERVTKRRRVHIPEDVGKRKRVLRPEGEQERVLGRGRLQLEVELAAELLAQGQRPGAVDAAAERRVQHELHPARFVEEALEDERLLRRDHAGACVPREIVYTCSAAPVSARFANSHRRSR